MNPTRNFSSPVFRAVERCLCRRWVQAVLFAAVFILVWGTASKAAYAALSACGGLSG